MQGYRGCDKFWETIQHYGTDCWKVEVLWGGLTLDEANIYEQIEIRDNNTLFPHGYNLVRGGGGMKGYNWTDEQKKRQSARLSGENHPMYGKPAHNKGGPQSEEARKKQSESMKGKPAWNKGKKMSPEFCRRNSEWKKRREYYPAQSFFMTLSAEMPIKEKRKQLYRKYPNVPKETIRRWISQWEEKRI